MADSIEQHAPELAPPTDSPIGAEAAQATFGENTRDAVDEPTDAEKTIETPDELGGTGGQQAGGAG